MRADPGTRTSTAVNRRHFCVRVQDLRFAAHSVAVLWASPPGGVCTLCGDVCLCVSYVVWVTHRRARRQATSSTATAPPPRASAPSASACTASVAAETSPSVTWQRTHSLTINEDDLCREIQAMLSGKQQETCLTLQNICNSGALRMKTHLKTIRDGEFGSFSKSRNV